MSRKFFNQRVNGNKTAVHIVIIGLCVIGVLICFVLANNFRKRNNKSATIKMRESVAVEVNSDLPDLSLFFTELEGVSESDINISYADVNIAQVGEYPITIKIKKEKYNSKLIVLDTISPELTVKDVKINPGSSYTAKDFVSSCKDNSKEDCQINFYSLATDQDGNRINYENYTAEGTYKIQIIASDSSENTTIEEATLTIGTGTSTEQPQYPTNCKYGNGQYDSNANILSTNVTENGCALDLNLYQDPNVLASANKIIENESEKLKKEFSKLNVEGERILNSNTEAILNSEGKGIVGYSIHIEVVVGGEIVESYFVDINGNRIFSINKYNLT